MNQGELPAPLAIDGKLDPVDRSEEAGLNGPSQAALTALPPDRIRPWLLAALTTLLVCRPLVVSESAGSVGDGLPLVMLWLVLLVAWLLRAFVRGDQRLRFDWTDAALVLLVVLHSAASVSATYHAAPRPALNMLWEWIGLGVAFFLTRQLVRPGASFVPWWRR